ncbi:MFS transporter [Streptomyces sp. ME19-01-6]|uniref:MFS transporter n=1 Tax=Streptomyces sp. ME19-01-6 TaxID=3028686 RepID=UPI0029BA3E85|nr:MFS transporter [Streptomyces sp. ME19-01-6]MDX3230459.1 MFS transporter [Streptomyces sp. ME19-01-6]
MTHTSTHEDTHGLPWDGLLALAVAGFVTVLTETVPAGLLPQISDGLKVSQATTGQLVTVYAAGSMLAAIPLTTLTRRWPRRPVLLATVLSVVAANAVTAASPWYALTFTGRLIAGLGAGLQWAMIAGYAMRMVPEASKGRALAISMAGVPLALAAGVPVGTALGTGIGWRSTFAVMAALGLIVTLWARAALPPIAAEAAHERVPVRRVLALPGIPALMLIAFAFEVAHMNMYTYIASFLSSSGLQDRVDVVLLVFGIAAITGLWLTGALIDRHLRAVVLTTFAAFISAMVLLATLGSSPMATVAAIAVWGMALGAAPTMLQAASARAAGSAMEIAQSLLVTMLNAGMAAGPLLGGALYATHSTGPLPWASLGLFAAVLGLAALTGRTAFPATTIGDAPEPGSAPQNQPDDVPAAASRTSG